MLHAVSLKKKTAFYFCDIYYSKNLIILNSFFFFFKATVKKGAIKCIQSPVDLVAVGSWFYKAGNVLCWQYIWVHDNRHQKQGRNAEKEEGIASPDTGLQSSLGERAILSLALNVDIWLWGWTELIRVLLSTFFLDLFDILGWKAKNFGLKMEG